MARKNPTLTEQVATLTAAVNALLAAQVAPVQAAPKQPKAQQPSAAFGGATFSEYVAKRRASAIACEIHPAAECNRSFSPKSSGREQHVARLV